MFPVFIDILLWLAAFSCDIDTVSRSKFSLQHSSLHTSLVGIQSVVIHPTYVANYDETYEDECTSSVVFAGLYNDLL